MKKTTLEIENQEAFVLCLALGTLKAIHSGAWPTEAGIWSLASPGFVEGLKPLNLSEEIISILEGADELSAIEKLLGKQAADKQIEDWIQTIYTRLRSLPVKSWSAHHLDIEKNRTEEKSKKDE